VGDQVVPRYLTERDHPWLQALLTDRARFAGRTLSELEAQRGVPLSVPAPKSKVRVAACVLDALVPARAVSVLRPAEVRWRLFHAAAAPSADRAAVVRDVAASLGVTPEELESALFGDLRGERRIESVPDDLSPSVLAARTNFAIAAALVRRSSAVHITASGDTEALVYRAYRLGLICAVAPLGTASRIAVGDGITRIPGGADAVTLALSGPLALFHHTEVYGRALASFIPALSACRDFELVARCKIGRGPALTQFVLRSGDPVFGHTAAPPAESSFEDRLALAFSRRASRWELQFRPVALDTRGEELAFADAELVHRGEPTRRWHLVFVGFWTVEHLARRLRALTAARLDRVLLCVDEKRRGRDGAPPEHPQLLLYKGRLDPRAILAKIGA